MVTYSDTGVIAVDYEKFYGEMKSRGEEER